MREIKFRVWDIELKYMREVIAISWKDGKLDTVTVRDDINGGCEIDAKHFILLEYTGLTDRNDRDVYEGDLLKAVRNSSFAKEGSILAVKFFTGSFDIYSPNCCERCKVGDGCISSLNEALIMSGQAFKIIGTIHENPELLKEVK